MGVSLRQGEPMTSIATRIATHTRTGIASCLFALAGCTNLYTSPQVNAEDPSAGVAVEIIPMTLGAIRDANATPYTPRRLPAGFFPPQPGPARQLALPRNVVPPAPRIPRTTTASEAATLSPLPETVSAPADPPARIRTRLPAPEQPQPYRIGISDTLLISLEKANPAGAGATQDQAGRRAYVVQDDGAVALPDLGRIPLAGLTLPEAQAVLFEAMVTQQRDPSFSLEISGFNSQRVSIGGAVEEPQLAPITLKPLFLDEALQIAGGVTPDAADQAVIRLFRDGQLFEANLSDLFSDNGLQRVLLKDGDALYIDRAYDLGQAQRYFEEQLRLRDADLNARRFAFETTRTRFQTAQLEATLQQIELQRIQIAQSIRNLRVLVENQNRLLRQEERSSNETVRASFRERLELGAVAQDFAYLAGEVEKQGRFALPFERFATLADVLFSSGGLPTATGDPSQIYVLRLEDSGRLQAFRLDATNAANLTVATRFEMRPRDIVFVAEQPVTVWNRVVSQLIPNLFSSAANLALRL